MLLGSGAGSSETASSIVADIIFLARYAEQTPKNYKTTNLTFVEPEQFEFPYIITFETEDVPGITGLITTAIGNQNINIDTVSHNRHNIDRAIFSVATMPCKLIKINNAIDEIKKKKAGILINEPKVIPILY